MRATWETSASVTGTAMSITTFDSAMREPPLRGRFADWFAAARARLGQETQKRPACSPEAPPVRRMVGARAAAGVCGAVAENKQRRFSSSGDCPKRRPASGGGGSEPLPCEIARQLHAEQQRGRELEHAFSHYVAPHVLDRLMADPVGVSLGGETRDISVLFADIRGFTALSELMQDDPQGLMRLSNAILGPLTDIVHAHGGTLDKYMGDCVMAFWGAPHDDPDHAQHAFEAAQAMLGAMDDINAWVTARFAGALPTIEIGIGLNSGACVVGNLGSQRRFDYSVLGDPVNVASRLEGLCKVYDTALVVGEATARRLRPGAPLREVDSVLLRGRSEKQRIHILG